MLDQIIDELSVRRSRAVPLNRPTVVLTPRGHAAHLLYAFMRQLRALDATDRTYALELLKVELVEMPPTA